MTSGAAPEDLGTDLGWALGAVLRAFIKRGGHVFADVPGGHRGYQVLLAAISSEGTQLALANRLGVDRTVMTYLLDDLEKATLIERKQDPNDRRARRIVVTDPGRTLVRVLREELSRIEADLLNALSETESTHFRTLLRTVAMEVSSIDPAGDADYPVGQCTDETLATTTRRS
jgi:DNA-binding MarR family transcriptional regulator